MGKIEEWKNIEGYPGYKISSFGRVKSNDRILKGRNKRTKTWINRLHKSQRKTYKAVIAENIKTGEKMYFDRLNSVSERGFSPSTVCQCCKLPPQSKIHKGYYFQYAYDPETSTPDKKRLLKEGYGVEVG